MRHAHSAVERCSVLGARCLRCMPLIPPIFLDGYLTVQLSEIMRLPGACQHRLVMTIAEMNGWIMARE